MAVEEGWGDRGGVEAVGVPTRAGEGEGDRGEGDAVAAGTGGIGDASWLNRRGICTETGGR